MARKKRGLRKRSRAAESTGAAHSPLKTEQQARQHETERFLLEAIERFPGMLSYWDRDLRCRAANPSYREWFGRTKEQMRGIRQQDLLGEEIFQKNKPYLDGVLRGENQKFERTVPKPDGTTGYTLVHFIADQRAGEVRGFYVYVTDVTSVKQDQDELRASDAALNSISQGVLISGPDQLIIRTNPAFSVITGYTNREMPGRNCRFLQGPLTNRQTVAAIRQALSSGKEFSGEILNYRKDGTAFWNELTISPVLGKNGEITHFIGVTRDITERKRAGEQKAVIEAELQQAQKLESIGRLAGGIAHDFNNVLSVILGHAEIVAQRSDLAPPVREAISEIHKAASRCANLSRQLLAFARKQTVAPKVLDLNLSLGALSKLLQILVGEQIEIWWRLKADPCLVRLDASQLDQIVINLCANAKDAITGSGTITIETRNFAFEEESGIRPSHMARGNYVSIVVSDTGCGMDIPTQAHIFDPFFTSKEVGKGTGLGLATVYGAVTQNGGFVEVLSKPGEGSTFSIFLPLYVDREG
jgi:two-component system, cell cycle sensor histidine kinase and response regulator CckA